jgi:hypothetical protein
VERFDPEHGGQFRARPGTKKKPGVKTPGWEALLLSHIKAPAQGGKAGSGKPPGAEFNKGKTTYQASVVVFFNKWSVRINTNSLISKP